MAFISLCSPNPLDLLLFPTFILPVFSSSIATFTDDKCENSYNSIDAENGYPNGSCLPLVSQGPFGSFQVVGLDPGCTATIYGSDSDPETPCSSTALQFAQLAACYNTSWVYYSIDTCTLPNQVPSPSPSPSSTSAPSKSNTGAIVGGVLGGVCGLAAIVAIIFLIIRRKKRRHQYQHQPGAPHEAAGNTLTELPPEGMKPELWTHEAVPHEMAANSVYTPPAELQGN